MADEIDQIKATNEKQNIKHINDHYDEIVDEALPDNVHRGDISTTTRLLGYTDAMMATCGTFLVLPLRNLNEMKKEETLAEYMHESRGEFIMFFIGFFIICTIWESINIRCIVIKRLDDFLVLLSIFQMLAIAVLPFSLALQGHFPEEMITIIITSIVLLIVEIFELAIIFYAFSSPKLIHFTLRTKSRETQHHFRFIMCFKPICNICLIVLAGLFCFVNYYVSWVLVSVLILTPLIWKLALYIRRQTINQTSFDHCPFFLFYTKGNISKERVEAFTDAAVAIIACVLILDITVEEFPKKEDVRLHGLNYMLEHMLPEFLVFFFTYTLVSFLWYVNHTVLHMLHTINFITLYLQKIFLAFLCLAPLFTNMNLKFVKYVGENTGVATRFSSLIALVSSGANLVIFLWGYYRNDKLFHTWSTKTHCKLNRQQNLYVLLKVCNIPFWCFVTFIGSFGSGNVPRIILICSTVGVNLSFVVLKFMFVNHVGKAPEFNLEEGISYTEKKKMTFVDENVELINENIEMGKKLDLDIKVSLPVENVNHNEKSFPNEKTTLDESNITVDIEFSDVKDDVPAEKSIPDEDLKIPDENVVPVGKLVTDKGEDLAMDEDVFTNDKVVTSNHDENLRKRIKVIGNSNTSETTTM